MTDSSDRHTRCSDSKSKGCRGNQRSILSRKPETSVVKWLCHQIAKASLISSNTTISYQRPYFTIWKYLRTFGISCQTVFKQEMGSDFSLASILGEISLIVAWSPSVDWHCEWCVPAFCKLSPFAFLC